MSLLIPRRLHWIWLGGQPLPDEHRRWIDGWLERHPGWEHVVWTDRNRPELVNEAAFLDARTPAQKADILRYELVYRYGGVYLDTDTECRRSFEPLLHGVDAFVVVEEPGAFATYCFGAASEHPWLRDLIARLPESMARGWSIMHQTGPRFFTSVTRSHPEVTVLEQTVFANSMVPAASHTRAYAIHHEAWSWREFVHAESEAKLAELAQKDVESVVPEGARFILVDKGHGLGVSGGRLPLPFPERDGTWAGYPADDAEAIAELERLLVQGACHIVFPAPMRYWLESYPGLARHLARNGRCVIDNERALVFDLRPHR
jgi:mannosyltransferase OCH1-like enzyme